MAAQYRRRVSSTEAHEGRMMITKDRLRRFPPPGERFVLHRGGPAEHVTVDAVHCECRGPALPHDHWFLAWPGLVAGSVVEIDRDGDEYVATVTEPGGRGRPRR